MVTQSIVQRRYRVGELLGQGAMRRVFRGFDKVRRAPVAIKQLMIGNLARQAAESERFRREGEALVLLNHPGIDRDQPPAGSGSVGRGHSRREPRATSAMFCVIGAAIRADGAGALECSRISPRALGYGTCTGKCVHNDPSRTVDRLRLAPTADGERNEPVDALRGLALFGVLLVNLQTEFRVSIFNFYAVFHTDGGRLNRATDNAIALMLESKAIAIFSFLFGVGMAMFFDRARCLGTKRACSLLLKRQLVLASFGFLHMLIWNGDILLLYAVAGLLALPALLVGPRFAIGAAVAIYLPYLIGIPLPGFPDRAAMLAQGLRATSVYGTAGLHEIIVFRARETCQFILPLLLGIFPRVLALIFAGMAAVRLGLLAARPRDAGRYLAAGVVGLGMGGSARVVELLGTTSQPLAHLAATFATIPFALGYVALFFWATTKAPGIGLVRRFAAIGRMSLSNYLAQSVLLGLVFFGYGLGLFGRLASAPVALGGIALYSVQVGVSRAWLEHFRFGPAEWLWRSLTWGRAQPFRKAATPVAASTHP